MKYSIQVKVMPHKELLDPQGKAVLNGLHTLGLDIDNVRVGKCISLEVDARDEAEARKIADEASKKLLANPVMEYYEIELSENN